jgi:lysophospholipase L1-like esterase
MRWSLGRGSGVNDKTRTTFAVRAEAIDFCTAHDSYRARPEPYAPPPREVDVLKTPTLLLTAGTCLALTSSVLALSGALGAPPLEIRRDNGAMSLCFPSEAGQSYMVRATSQPDAAGTPWTHIVSVRGQPFVDWRLPAKQTGQAKRFFRVERVAARGVANLAGWAAFRAAPPGTARYQIGLIGDSYTHTRQRYAQRLKRTLAAQHGNLGAGFLGFGRYSATAGLNGSIDDAELAYAMSGTQFAQWDYTNGSGYGPDSGHITSNTASATLSFDVMKTVETLKIYHVKTPGSAGYRHRTLKNGTPGAWTQVTTSAALGLGIETLDVASALPAPYTVEIEALGAGVTLIGAEAVKSGAGVVVHKLGASGRRAVQFAANNTARDALKELNLDMAVIMFGTNEQGANQTPPAFKSGLQNIITTLRNHNPATDIVLLLPCHTKYELEEPKAYKMDDYRQAMIEVANVNNAAFMDFTEVFGPATELQNLIEQGLMNTDRLHPSSAVEGSGGFLIADTILASILSVP